MIDYKIIDDSIKYYTQKGFTRIESPWTVTRQVSEITKPIEATVEFEIKYNEKVLVASGEQSFLYLALKGFLPKGKYQTITPCFRYEKFDFLHTKYFIKNELINTDDPSDSNLQKTIETSLIFFKKYLPEAEVIKTEIGYDIQWGKYELGSYGIRQCEFLKWIYGTGVAEPRLSNLINLKNQ